MKPGQAIDALKRDIKEEELKGKNCIAEFNECSIYIKKTQVIT